VANRSRVWFVSAIWRASSPVVLQLRYGDVSDTSCCGLLSVGQDPLSEGHEPIDAQADLGEA
jgi:hypothetical protein